MTTVKHVIGIALIVATVVAYVWAMRLSIGWGGAFQVLGITVAIVGWVAFIAWLLS